MTSQILTQFLKVITTWCKRKSCKTITDKIKAQTVVAKKQSSDRVEKGIHTTKLLSSTENILPQLLPFSLMRGPNGIKRYPYIGTVLMFKPFSRFTPETFGELINQMHDKYGSVFKCRLGKNFSVFTDSAQDAETVFRNEGAFPIRRNMRLRQVFLKRNGLPNALGTVSGPEWQELRRPLNPLVNRPQVCLHYLPAQNKVADDFVHRLHTIKFNPNQLSEEFFKFASESIGVVCFNQRLGFLNSDLSHSPERLRLLEAFKTVLHCTFVDLIGLERRYLLTVDDPFYKKFEESMKYIRTRSLMYVEKVMKKLESRSITSVCSNESNHNTETESNLLASLIVGSKLEMDKILSIIDSMLIAGTDSTARNLAMLFYNLAVNPQAQANATKEVTSLIGHDGPVLPEALANMNYLKSCVKESMRIHFPLSNGTERILAHDTAIGGYCVPKGTSVIMSSRRSSINARYFTDPHKFMPERWMRNSNFNHQLEDSSSAFAYLPFGHGSRGCIGRRFAEMEMYVGAAKVLQKLKIKVDPSYSGPDIIYTPFITPINPIPFIFSERRR